MRSKNIKEFKITKECLDEQAYKKIEQEKKERIKKNKSFK